MVAFMRVFAVAPARDLVRAREFYEGVLGLTPIQELTEGVLYRVGESRLYLYPTPWAGSAGHTLASFEVSDIRQAVTDLQARGVVFEEYDYPELRTVDSVAVLEGEYAAWFRDSEGNILALGQLR